MLEFIWLKMFSQRCNAIYRCESNCSGLAVALLQNHLYLDVFSCVSVFFFLCSCFSHFPSRSHFPLGSLKTMLKQLHECHPTTILQIEIVTNTWTRMKMAIKLYPLCHILCNKMSLFQANKGIEIKFYRHFCWLWFGADASAIRSKRKHNTCNRMANINTYTCLRKGDGCKRKKGRCYCTKYKMFFACSRS